MQEQVLQSLITITSIVWPVALLLVLAFISGTSWFKETAGKVYVYLYAQRKLQQEGYRILKHFELPTENGNIAIDHIIVSSYGVFIVETINLRGWITGVAHHQTWKQEINGQLHKFPNPLMHNDLHIKAMFKMLNLDDHHAHRVIMFTGDTVFKSEMPENVVRNWGYLKYILSKTDQVLAEPQVESIVANLQSGELAEKYQTHWQNVRDVERGNHWSMME